MPFAVLIVISSLAITWAQFAPYGSMNYGSPMMSGGRFPNEGMYNMVPQTFGQQPRINGAVMYNPGFGSQNIPQMSLSSPYGSSFPQQPSNNMNSMGSMGSMGNMGSMGSMGLTSYGSAQQFAPSPYFNQGGDASGFGQQNYGFMNQGGAFGQFQGDSNMNNVPREENQNVSGATRIIPPFLKTASKSEQDKFYQIVQNPTWTATQKQEKIDEFVRGLEVDAQNLYAEFQRSSHGSSSEKKRQVHEAVHSMSTEAQAQFQKVSALMTNAAISDSERLQKIQEIYDKIPANIKKEFDSKFSDL